MTLEGFTDEQLKAELKTREKRAREQREKDLWTLQSALIARMTHELVDVIAPLHGRTSCSDADLTNGFRGSGFSVPRCNRCALLEMCTIPTFDPTDMGELVLRVEFVKF